MKHIVFALSIVPILLFSQRPYTIYTNSILNKDFKIELSAKKDTTLYIYCNTEDPVSSYGGVILRKAKGIQLFKEEINYIKSKYIEWRDVSIKNKVTQFNKKIEIENPLYYNTFFEFNREVYKSYPVRLNYIFAVTDKDDETIHALYIYTNNVKSMSNEFVENKELNFVFLNEDEINDFINKVDINSIRKHLSKPSVDDLFKNE